MAKNYTLTIERLVEDFGWDVLVDELLLEAATAPQDELDDLGALIDAAIELGQAQGEVIIS